MNPTEIRHSSSHRKLLLLGIHCLCVISQKNAVITLGIPASAMNQTAFTAPAALSTTTFVGKPTVSRRHNEVHTVRPRRANLVMRSQANIAKKAVKVASAKEWLSKSQMIFSTSLEGLSVAQISNLKRSLPPGTKAATVKNSLMRRAISESEWEVAGELTKQSSLWFFIEEDIRGTMKAYQEFAKELDRDPVQGGVFESTLYDTKGVESIAALPSKKELLEKIAVSLKLVPTKFASGIKAVPTKLATAIKLAVADEDGGESSE